MKTSAKIISGALATVMVASTLAIGGVSASAATVKKPTKVKAVNTSKGIKISWKKVKGASKYKVYRGKKVIKTVKKVKYTDKTVKAGKKYTYRVKAVKGKATSKFSKKVKATRLTKPTLSSVKNAATGVKVSWKKVKGANQYKVYRKTTGSWQIVATVKTKTYTDTKVTSATTYSYKVAAYKSTTKSTSVASAVKKVTFVPAPTDVVAAVNADKTAVDVSWTAVKGATTYAVYRKGITETSYTKVAAVKTNAYTDANVGANPTAYDYKVVAGKNNSSVDSAVARAFFAPKGSYAKDAEGNLTVNLTLKAGESYAEGKALIAELALGTASYEVTTAPDAAVAEIADDVINAKAAGTTTATLKLADATVTKLNPELKAVTGKELTTPVVNVVITVA